MGREVERKYEVVAPKTQSQLEQAIRSLGCALEAMGTDVDTYWAPSPTGGIARHRSRMETVEEWLTVKHKDKGTNEDRSETELELPQGGGKELLRSLLGPELGSVTKYFSKFYAFPSLEVAVYRVDGDPRIFLEVESKKGSLSDVITFESHLEAEEIKFFREHRSIYEMFIEKKEAA